jgi:hypothetical protein
VKDGSPGNDPVPDVRKAPGQPGAPRAEAVESGWRQRTLPVGSIGYTGSYREPSAEIIEVSVTSVLEARGPE